MGGPSSEREVSLVSGQAVSDALISRGYNVTNYDLDSGTHNLLVENKPDVVFIALHGSPGEDGTVQGMLELIGLPYTGSGVLGSSLAMDKARTRSLLEGKIRIPKGVALGSIDDFKTAISRMKKQNVELPVIVKPSQAGSSVGLSRVLDEDGLLPAVEEAFKFSSEVIIEECLTGPEVTISIIGNEKPVLLPTIEITSEKGIYDYEAKYTPGMSHHIIPPNIDPVKVREAEAMCLKAYKLLGLSGCGRGEVMFSKDLVPHFLELNTIPGFTEVSLLPDAARAAGIEFGELCEKLIGYAIERHDKMKINGNPVAQQSG